GAVLRCLSPELLWLIADWPLAIWLIARVSRDDTPGPSLRASVAVVAAVVSILMVLGVELGARQVLASTPLDQMFRDRSVVERLGPLGYHAYDLWNYAHGRWRRPPATEAEVQDALSGLVERQPLRAGPLAPGF